MVEAKSILIDTVGSEHCYVEKLVKYYQAFICFSHYSAFLSTGCIIRPLLLAKSLQSCLALCDPIGGSPPGPSVPGILQASTPEWVAISFSNAWKWKVKVKSLSRVWLLATPWTTAHQAPPSMGFSRQEYWTGVPLPSPASGPRQVQTYISHYGFSLRITSFKKALRVVLGFSQMTLNFISVSFPGTIQDIT